MPSTATTSSGNDNPGETITFNRHTYSSTPPPRKPSTPHTHTHARDHIHDRPRSKNHVHDKTGSTTSSSSRGASGNSIIRRRTIGDLVHKPSNSNSSATTTATTTTTATSTEPFSSTSSPASGSRSSRRLTAKSLNKNLPPLPLDIEPLIEKKEQEQEQQIEHIPKDKVCIDTQTSLQQVSNNNSPLVEQSNSNSPNSDSDTDESYSTYRIDSFSCFQIPPLSDLFQQSPLMASTHHDYFSRGRSSVFEMDESGPESPFEYQELTTPRSHLQGGSLEEGCRYHQHHNHRHHHRHQHHRSSGPIETPAISTAAAVSVREINGPVRRKTDIHERQQQHRHHHHHDHNPSRSSVLSYRPENNSYAYKQHGDQKRIRERYNTVREFIETEVAFATDLGVIVDVYIEKLKMEPFFCYVCNRDVASLASNVERILQLSRQFVATLRETVPAVVMAPENVKNGKVLEDVEMRLGQAVLEYIPLMEREFKFYCDRTAQQNATFNRIKELASPAIELWLQECYKESIKDTRAGSLDALLIKPVQRLLKYPLLLAKIKEATLVDHPDYYPIVKASEAIDRCTHLIDMTHQQDRGDLTDEETEQILMQLQFEPTADHVLERLLEQFHTKRRRVAALVAAIRENTRHIQQVFDSNCQLAKSWLSWRMIMAGEEQPEPFVDNALSQLGRKYKNYALFTAPFTSQSSNSMSTAQLSERIEKEVMTKLGNVMSLYDATHKIIKNRQQLHSQFSRYVSLRKNNMMDDTTVDVTCKNDADQFVRQHNSLKDGLPDFFQATEGRIHEAMAALVSIEKEWFMNAANSLAEVFNLEPQDIQRSDPCGSQDPIVERFKQQTSDSMLGPFEHLSLVGSNNTSSAASNNSATSWSVNSKDDNEHTEDTQSPANTTTTSGGGNPDRKKLKRWQSSSDMKSRRKSSLISLSKLRGRTSSSLAQRYHDSSSSSSVNVAPRRPKKDGKDKRRKSGYAIDEGCSDHENEKTITG